MREVSVDALQTAIGRALWQWYLSQGNEQQWPPLGSFRPEDMPARVLPHLGVVDVEQAPFRVYYRLVGSVIAESLGHRHIQGYLDTLGLEQEADLIELYRYTVAANRPLFMTGQQVVDDQEFTYEGGALPLGTPQDPVRRFIIFEDFLHTESWRSAVRRRSYRPDST